MMFLRQATRSPILFTLLCFLGLSLGARNASAEDDSKPRMVDVTAQELHTVIEDSSAQVVLVNFWATWCGPCVKEFPSLVKLQQEYPPESLQVVFVSADFASSRSDVEAFLEEQNVDFTTYFKTGSDNDFITGSARNGVARYPPPSSLIPVAS